MKKLLSICAVALIAVAIFSCKKDSDSGIDSTPLQKLSGTWTYKYCIPTYDLQDTISPSGFGLQQLVFDSCSDVNTRCGAYQLTSDNISIQWQYALDNSGKTLTRYNSDSTVTEYQITKLDAHNLEYVDTIQQYSYYLTK